MTLSVTANTINYAVPTTTFPPVAAESTQNILSQPQLSPKPLDPETVKHITEIDLEKFRHLPAQFNRLERWLWIIPIIGWIALLIIHFTRKKERLIANDSLNQGICNIYQAVQMVDATLQWRYIYERGRQNLLLGRYPQAYNDFKSIEIEDELCEDDNFPPDFLYLKANAARESGNLWEAYDSYEKGMASIIGNGEFQRIQIRMKEEFAQLDHFAILLSQCQKMIEDKTATTDNKPSFSDALVIKEWTPDFKKHLQILVTLSQKATLERKIAVAKILFSLDLQKSWCFAQANQLLNSILGFTTVVQKVDIARMIPREDEKFNWLNAAYQSITAKTVERGRVSYELGKWYLEKWKDYAHNRFSTTKFTEADTKEMLNFLEEALDLGVEDARTELSAIFSNAKGVVENPAKAHYWAQIHGKNYTAVDLRYLASLYLTQHKTSGLVTDLKSSLEWYEKTLDLAKTTQDTSSVDIAQVQIKEIKDLLAHL